MKVCIGGGAGFLGSHLTDYYIARGDSVTVIDNLSTGVKENVSLEAEFIWEDIQYARYFDYDLIINMASPASPIHYSRLGVETLLSGSAGTHRLLEIARLSGARFFQASTSEIYGDPLEHPQKESYWGNVNSYGPRAVYDEAKRFSEALVWAYHQKGVDTCIGRIFNTYGPRMAVDDGRVISNFIVAALKKEPLMIYGSGKQTRSLCYVSDTVKGIVSLIESGHHDPVNLGNPEEYTVEQIAKKIKARTKSVSKLVHVPLPEDDPTRRRPDITLARSLGWNPEVILDTGLKKTVEYFKGVI